MEKIREGVLTYGSIAVVFLVPMMYMSTRVFPHITSKTFFFYGIVETLFAVWIYSAIVDPTYRLSKRQLYFLLPILLFIVWFTLAGVMAVNPHLAFWSSLSRGTGIISLYHCVALCIVLVSLVNRYSFEIYGMKILRWIVYAGGIVAVSVWCANEGFDLPYRFLQQSQGGGLVGNSSLAATYLLLVLCIGLFLVFSPTVSRSRKNTIIVISAVVLGSPLFMNIHGLLVGKSIVGSAHGATIGIVVGLGVTVLGASILSKNKGAKVVGWSGVVLGLVAFVYVWSQLLVAGSTINQKFIQIASGTRFIFWNVASESMHAHPWLGYGPENYMIALQDHFDPKMLLSDYGFEAWDDRAHNVYYDMGVSGGYPAIMLYAFVLISFGYVVYELFSKKVLSRWQASTLWGLLIGYIFQNLFVFDSLVSYVIFFAIVGVFVGAGRGMYAKERGGTKQISQSSGNLIAGVLIIMTAIIWYNTTWLPSRKAIAFGRILDLPLNTRAESYPKLSLGSSIGNDWDVGGFGHNLFKLYAAKPEEVKSNPKIMRYAPTDVSTFLEYLEKVDTQNEHDYRLKLSIIHLYSTYIFLTDKPVDPVYAQHILDLAQEAEKLSPNDPQTYWSVTPILTWLGSIDAAQAAYEKAISIDPSIPISHTLLIQFAEGLGNKKLAQQALAQAEKDIPGFTYNQ